jgi:hypothetical protein
LEEGDHVRCEHRDLVVRSVGVPDLGTRAEERGEGGADRGRRWRAFGADLMGADLLVELGPSVIFPGSTWRAECLLCRRGRVSPRKMGYADWEEPVFEAADLGEVLDAIVAWARGMQRKGVVGRAHGWARLRAVEPGASPAYSRVLVSAPLPEGGVIDALDAFVAEAERRYEQGADREAEEER